MVPTTRLPESRLGRALVLSLAARACAVISGTISVSLYLGAFGAERYGFWGAILGVTSYLRVLNLGISQTVSSDLASAAAETSTASSIATVRHGLRGFARALPAALPITVGLAFLIPWTSVFHARASMLAEFRLVAVLIVATFLLEMPAAVLRAATVGLGGVSYERLVAIGTALARLAVAGLAAALEFGLATVVVSLFAVSIAGGAALAFWLARRLPGVFRLDVAGPQLEIATRARFRIASAHYLALQIAGAVLWNSDPFLAGLTRGTTGAAQVSVAWRVLSLLLMAGPVIGLAVAPKLVRWLARGERKDAEELLTVAAATTFAVATGGVVVLALGGETLFDLWLPPGMYLGGACWAAYLVLILVQSVLEIATDFITMAGEHTAYARMELVEAALKIGLAVALVPNIGLIGLPLASLAGRALTAPLLVRSTARLLRVPAGRWLWRVTRPSLLPTLVALGVWLLLGRLLAPSRAATMVMLASTGAAFASVFLLSPVPRSFLRLARANTRH